MPTLHLLVGLPCSGKTTLSKQLEVEYEALRFTPDEWHRYLYGQDATHPEHDDRHQRIETLQWQVAASALKQGINVILDFGLWTKAERQDFRQRATNLGAKTCLHFLDVPYKELIARLEKRNQQSSAEVTYIPIAKMDEYRLQFQVPDAEELSWNDR